jgi:hypothetical protein
MRLLPPFKRSEMCPDVASCEGRSRHRNDKTEFTHHKNYMSNIIFPDAFNSRCSNTISNSY